MRSKGGTRNFPLHLSLIYINRDFLIYVDGWRSLTLALVPLFIGEDHRQLLIENAYKLIPKGSLYKFVRGYEYDMISDISSAKT